MKTTAFMLAAALFIAPVTVRPANAEGAGNETIGILAGVCVLFAVVAWQMDFGDDDIGQLDMDVNEDLKLVLCDTPRIADSDTTDLGAALAMRAEF